MQLWCNSGQHLLQNSTLHARFLFSFPEAKLDIAKFKKIVFIDIRTFYFNREKTSISLITNCILLRLGLDLNQNE